MNNQPAKLDKFVAFRENPFPVDIVLPDVFEITEPVTVELWVYDVLQDVEIPVTVDGQTVSFELTVEQLRLISEGYLYVLFDGQYVLGAPIGTTMDASIPTSRTIATDVPTIGIIRVSVYSDAYSAQVATEQAEVAKNYAASAELSKSAAEAAKIAAEEAAANAQLDFVPLGTWNAATNTPTLTTDASAVPAGHGYEVGTGQGGTQSITGESVDFVPTDKVVSNGTEWFLRKVSDEALVKVQELKTFITEFASFGVYPLVKDPNNRLIIGIDEDGAVYMPTVRDESFPWTSLKNVLVEYSQLSSDAKQYMWEPLDPLTGFCYCLKDSAGAILLAIRNNQQVYIPSLDYTLPNGSVNINQLSSDLQALINIGGTVNPDDRVLDDVDDVRAANVPIQMDISSAGTNFARFPRRTTPVLFGVNDTGTDLEFRKSTKIPVRATRRIGTYDPTAGGTAPTELFYIGLATAAPSLSGRVNGDYYRVMTGKTSSVTINSQACYGGDLIVYVSGAWIKKAAPSVIANARPGQWWNVTVAGTFDGVSYSVGDIIYCHKQQSAGGSGLTRFYSKLGANEFAHVGNFDPGTFVPSVTVERVIYTASAVGTYDSKTFAKYDTIVRINSAWHKITSETVITVANGGYVNLPCQNADDIEVRRVDGTYVTAGTTVVKLSGKTANLQKVNSPSLVVWGDSMVPAGLGTLGAAMAPRSVTLRGYPGGTSEEIYTMLEAFIKEGDPYFGYTHIFYHGQNELRRTIEFAHKMYNVAGARDRRFLFLSVLGSRGLTWNGTRLVAATLEDAFAQTGLIYEIEQAYQALWPGNYINTRQMLLTTSALLTTVPDLTFPGLTQAQVATTYGITGHSYHFDYSVGVGATQLPYPATELVFQGFHNSASAPTGGADKDYYVSRFAGDEGRIWIRSAGSWISRVSDDIHVNTTAQPVYNAAVVNFFTSKKL